MVQEIHVIEYCNLCKSNRLYLFCCFYRVKIIAGSRIIGKSKAHKNKIGTVLSIVEEDGKLRYNVNWGLNNENLQNATVAKNAFNLVDNGVVRRVTRGVVGNLAANSDSSSSDSSNGESSGESDEEVVVADNNM